MTEVARGREQRRDIGPTQDHGQLLLAAWIGNVLDHPGDAQGGVIKEPESAHGLIEGGPRRFFLLDEIELIRTHMFRAQAIGRRVKMPGKGRDTAQIRPHGLVGVVAGRSYVLGEGWRCP